MAAANESQGLKIAVASFVTLSVILAVTSYFLYSGYSQAEARLQSESEKLSQESRAKGLAVTQLDDFRKVLGARAEEYDPAKAEITAHLKKVDSRLNDVATAVNTAVSKAEAAGAQGQELTDARDKVQQLIQSFRSEPNKSYMSALDRFAELFENLSLLTTELSLDYVDTRRTLEAVNRVNKEQLDVQAKAASDSKADLQKEHDDHSSQRASLLTKVDTLQTLADEQATEIANLKAQVRQQEDDYVRKIELLNTILREQSDQLSKTETVLDRPDGHITYVDYERGEVQVDINRRMGARPQMKMTIFDRGAPGIPTDRPKGNIELTKVGEQFSIARIIKTNSPIEPLRVGDIVYSPAWSPNQPTQYALIGKIDVNRDGRDDRAELKRMIEEAGGVVEFDLPPPDVGKESGKLTPRIDWYVIDERTPLREVFTGKASETTLSEQGDFEKRRGEIIKEARLDGIRPMLIERLLSYLGYDYAAPIVGRPEAVNTKALDRLAEPRVRGEQAAPAGENQSEPENEPQ
jgi:hypothetical protein